MFIVVQKYNISIHLFKNTKQENVWKVVSIVPSPFNISSVTDSLKIDAAIDNNIYPGPQHMNLLNWMS
jgi:hypothetical protein